MHKWCNLNDQEFIFRFAFAETESKEEIEKAMRALDSKEIAGRRLRVRSAKNRDGKMTSTTESVSK